MQQRRFIFVKFLYRTVISCALLSTLLGSRLAESTEAGTAEAECIDCPTAAPENVPPPLPRPTPADMRPRPRPENLPRTTRPGPLRRVPRLYNVGFPLDPLFRSRGADCTHYVRNDGTLGRTGVRIVSEIMGTGRSTKRTDLFFSNEIKDIELICPNWKNPNIMTRRRKAQFYVWHMAAIAWAEGTCKVNISRRDATNGRAGGELQMEESFNLRKNRGPGCNATDARVTAVNSAGRSLGEWYMANPANYIPCAIEILGGSLCGKYSGNGGQCTPSQAPRALTGGHQYWQKLRRGPSGDIIKRTKTFKPCGNS